MQFSTLILLSLTTLALSSPVPKKSHSTTTTAAAAAAATTAASAASTASTASGASVLSSLSGATYDSISISAGTAGNAEAEANALFANIDTTNLAGVSASDLKIIKGVHDVAEDAETGAFNAAVSAATGDAATALQNGKIKNKVLKLTAEVLGIQIDAAQGGDGSDLAAEQTKLTNNIKLDTAAAGQASTAVDFTGTV